VPRSDRSSIIRQVKVPLSYFTLAALIVEAVLGGLAFKLADKNLAYVAGAILTLYVLVVAAIAVFKPGVLSSETGTSMDNTFALGLAEEFYTALDGYYSNLSPDERAEAYEFLRKTIATSPHIQTPEQRKFCTIVVDTIVRKASLTHEGRTPGSSPQD
jgi:hypothetical protein